MNKRYEVSENTTLMLEKVFNKLKEFLPESYRKIQLGLVFTDIPAYKTYQGGYATLSTINIGTEYVNTYKKEIAYAEILAHELGHHVLGHIHVGQVRQVTPQEEQDADHFGMFLCELAGYGRKDYIDWFEEFETGEFRADKLTAKHIEEHGTGSERIEKLKIQDRYLKNIDNF